MHDMFLERLRLHRTERSKSDVERDGRETNALSFEVLDELRREMETSRRCGNGTNRLGIDGLVRRLGVGRRLFDIWRRRYFADAIGPGENVVGRCAEVEDDRSVVFFVDDLHECRPGTPPSNQSTVSVPVWRVRASDCLQVEGGKFGSSDVRNRALKTLLSFTTSRSPGRKNSPIS